MSKEKSMFQFIMGTESLHDGMGTPEKFISRAQELGLNNLCLSDRSTTSGYVNFFPKTEKGGIKPI